jgi:hypothetical protein
MTSENETAKPAETCEYFLPKQTCNGTGFNSYHKVQPRLLGYSVNPTHEYRYRIVYRFSWYRTVPVLGCFNHFFSPFDSVKKLIREDPLEGYRLEVSFFLLWCLWFIKQTWDLIYSAQSQEAVLLIRDILVRIRICGSVPLTYGPECGSRSCFFRQWLTRWQQTSVADP